MNLVQVALIIASLAEHLIDAARDAEGVVVFGENDVFKALSRALDDGHITVDELLGLCEAFYENSPFRK